ncbi:MAG: ABC transporter ATP-binding protein, partial [Marivirga sp.]|nr:ABC transporter ATP-binding protein [Marivirga sp.]
YFKQKIKIPKVEHVQESLPVVQEIPNWVKQLKVFITRDVLSKISNKQYLYINLLEAPVLAFFIAFMVKYYDYSADNGSTYSFFNNSNIPVYFFMSVVVALFFGLTMSAEEIFRDRKILKREEFLHLSRSSYLLSKVIVMFTFSAIQTFLFILIGNTILGIPLMELRYWVILFSCSCFANMLGLNISSSFDSAVTIYILIPLLVIPQLLLSGVVISFDKFNPKVGKPIGVPIIGEVMASRWAFEAFMVTQFKDNPYQKQFYPLDQAYAESEYKRVYYIPELESKLAYCLNHRSEWRNINASKLAGSLSLLQREITNELKFIGGEKFPAVDSLVIGQIDSLLLQKTSKFLMSLRQYYSLKMKKISEQRENLIAELTNTPAKALQYEANKTKYANKAVTDAVENISSPQRIVEYKGTLVQKIYPIYLNDHKPANLFDFSANLYQPSKHFAGVYIDTLYFNLIIIWLMTLMLFITLYLDALKRL